MYNPNGASNACAATHQAADYAQHGGGLVARVLSADPLAAVRG